MKSGKMQIILKKLVIDSLSFFFLFKEFLTKYLTITTLLFS